MGHSGVLLLWLSCVMLPPPAYAYGDLSTASYVSQLILAGIFGGTLSVKIVWSWLVRSLRREN